MPAVGTAYFFPGEEDISPGAHKVNGLTKDFLLGFDEAVTGLPKWLKWLKEQKGSRKLCLIGHNIEDFDIPILVQEMDRNGIARTKLTNLVTSYVDTRELVKSHALWNDANREFPWDSKSLGNLYRRVFNEEIPNAHSSIGDVRANMKLLLELDPTMKYTKLHMNDLGMLVRKIGRAVKQGIISEATTKPKSLKKSPPKKKSSSKKKGKPNADAKKAKAKPLSKKPKNVTAKSADRRNSTVRVSMRSSHKRNGSSRGFAVANVS